MPSYTRFEELDCYKKCREVRVWVDALIKSNSKIDRDLIQNIRRAARSSTRNIAEGFGRHHHKENIQFCRIARGSLHEIFEDLNIMKDENMSDEETLKQGRILIAKALKSLNEYIKYLNTLTTK
ncbi:MAG: four helix bundle protein [Saprospiraceae bacterium]|nr:four helix bundle protein [Saprospiraceae bacterium]